MIRLFLTIVVMFGAVCFFRAYPASSDVLQGVIILIIGIVTWQKMGAD